MKKIFSAFSFFIFICNGIYAQLCTGSLGDPVVNITFGNDNTSAGPLKAGVTNLKYVTGCPGDGEYGIKNLSFGCFGNTWYLLAGDHTGDVGGRYMVINASFEPSDFYVDTVSGLCGNTVYEFAAWVANILKSNSCSSAGIKPNLTFRIETIGGVVLKKFDSGDILPESEKTWKQFGTFFSTPTSVSSVILRITNNANGGCGNDLILDDITFRACGPKVNSYVNNDSIPYLNICENNRNDFKFIAAFSVGFTDPVLQWQLSADTGKTWMDIAGERNSTYIRKPSGKGVYAYRAVIAERGNFNSIQCRIASNVTTITISPIPIGPTKTSVLGCTNTDVRMDALQGSGLTYAWTGPNGFLANTSSVVLPKVVYKDSGNYFVKINTELGCNRVDTFQLGVFQGAIAFANANTSICEGSSSNLFSSGGIKYNWSPISGLNSSQIANPKANPLDTTTYKVIVTNQFGCKDSAVTTVNVWKKPIVNAGTDSKIYEGESVILQGQISGTNISFSWSPTSFMSNSNSLSPTVSPNDKITYSLTGSSDLGCGTTSDQVSIFVYKKVRAPNSFSPNGDGINDTWVITGLDSYPDAVLRVYSRDGKVVFQTRGTEKIWDGTYNGKPLPVGTYYYLIDLYTGQPILSGWILIIR